MNCQFCGVELPADARFCIECGAEQPLRASTGATTLLPRSSATAIQCRVCGAASPEGADFCVGCGRRLAEPPPVSAPQPAPLSPPPATPAPVAPRGRLRRRDARRISTAVFFIALGLLLLLKLPFWPMILVVCGLSSFVYGAIRGRVLSAVDNTLWLFGLAFLFTVPRLWLPGLIILIGMSVLISIGRKRLGVP
jgi:ribosomal protein L40E